MAKQVKVEKTLLEVEEDRLLEKLKDLDPDSDEYDAIIGHVETLQKCKLEESKIELEKSKVKHGRRISKDTIAIIAGNLLGIGLILGFEKANIITTKALGFILKGRV
jgi:hypothetical protein